MLDILSLISVPAWTGIRKKFLNTALAHKIELMGVWVGGYQCNISTRDFLGYTRGLNLNSETLCVK